MKTNRSTRPQRVLLLLSILLMAAVLTSSVALAQDKDDEAWIEIKGGLKYIDEKVGQGDEVRRGKLANVHYTGYLSDGTKFQSSRDAGKSFVFEVGLGQVVKGWDLGVRGMFQGGVRRLYIPAKMGYGRKGVKAGDQWMIPPNEDLIFVVEVLTVN